MYTKYQNATLLFLRLVIAAIFLVAAYGKFQFWSIGPSADMPAFMLYLMRFLSIVEPIGALAIVIGFLPRLAALGLSVIMVGAIAIFFNIGFMTPTGGWSFNLMILAGTLITAAFGMGDWTLIRKRKETHVQEGM